MGRDISLDEVVEHFTLDGGDLELIRDKAGRLGFSVMFRYLLWRASSNISTPSSLATTVTRGSHRGTANLIRVLTSDNPWPLGVAPSARLKHDLKDQARTASAGNTTDFHLTMASRRDMADSDAAACVPTFPVVHPGTPAANRSNRLTPEWITADPRRQQ